MTARPRTTPSRTLRRGRAVAVALVMVGALAGCLSLPTSGPVAEGVDVVPPGSGVELFAPGPAADAPPEDIVEGFLLAAGSGLGDDFDRAREFLTPAGSQAWDPSLGVTVYTDPASLRVEVGQAEPDGTRIPVTVTATVTAALDATGAYTASVPTEQEFAFQLVQIAGEQWRISILDPGVLMSGVTFGQQFREVSVYFLASDDGSRLVPDARWVPRSGSADATVDALLAGPSAWLQSGVISAFPDGTELGLDGVELDDRVATVTLSTQMLEASPTRRALALAQLEATLGQLGQIGSVDMSVDGAVLSVDTSLAAVASTPVPPPAPTLVTADGLGTLTAGGVAPVTGAAPLPDGVGQVALPYDDGPAVGLADSRTLVALPTASSEQVALLERDGRLLEPSYDVHGWVWTGPTGPGSSTGTLAAVDPVGGAQVEVSAPDLVGADVVVLRLSREGTRLAYAVRSDDDVTVYVAAVVRDPDGTPVSIATGRAVGVPLAAARDLAWVDETTLAVLGSGDGALTVLLMGVGGRTVALPSVDGAAAIAAGDGDRELFVVTGDGQLYGRSGTGWRVVSPEPVRDPAFPG